ncbi:hypothetical protein SAMN04487976_103184 [Xaviernesmea oryzae]|nr:hypothetical protein SAMN04487976_103184 [Xaviernesmea oryzae]
MRHQGYVICRQAISSTRRIQKVFAYFSIGAFAALCLRLRVIA